MRKTKRLLSTLLALCMALALLPATALADDTDGLPPEAGGLTADELGMLRKEAWDGEYVVPGSGATVEIDMTGSGLPGEEDAGGASAFPVTARYTVLVLDCSGSMSSQPMQTMKAAATSFCQQMTANSDGNYIAIVPFDSTVKPVTQFTNSETVLTQAIDALDSNGSTNLNAAMEQADQLLAAQPGGMGIVKNILILSDGLPQTGETKTSGRYSPADSSYYYQYANVCYETARDDMWPHYNVYTLGFLHDVGLEKAFCARFLRDMANRLYYEVQDADHLQFVFDEFFDDLGTTDDEDPIIIVPGITGSNGLDEGTQADYTALMSSLRSSFPGRHVQLFDYDWSKSGADSAAALHDTIEGLLSGSEAEKVDLVCHGMGGLVASSYFNQYTYNDRKVDKVITCGAPYEGSPEIISRVMGSQSFRSCPGVAELSPTKEYVGIESMWEDMAYVSGNKIDAAKYQEKMNSVFDAGLYGEAASFQNSIRDNGVNSLYYYHKSFYAVGTNQLTVSSVVFDSQGGGISDLVYERRGDGTVPYLSATMNHEMRSDLYYGERWAEFDASHSGLVTDPACIQWMVKILDKNDGVSAGRRLNSQGYVVLRVACPVDVTVSAKGETLSSAQGSLKTEASFGRLDIVGTDAQPIKILCLDTGNYDNLQLTGTGNGDMDFTVRYFDNAGTLVSEKTEENIPVTADTVYTAVVPASKDAAVTLTRNTGHVIVVEQDVNFVPVEDVTFQVIPDYLEREDAVIDWPALESNYIAVKQTTGGEVVPSTRRAAIGELVSLSVNPDDGYELDTLTITDSRGRSLSYRSLGGSRYSFIMSGYRVTVEAKFVRTDGSELPGADEPFTGLGTPGISGIVLNPAVMPFSDVRAGDWFYDNVDYVWKHYLMSGVSDSQFAPGVTTSRGMIWTILARMNNVRTDINPGATWFERGMLWSMEQGVTDGSNALGDITREQLATMLWRNAGRPAPGAAADLSRFSDSAAVSGYAATAVRWAVSMGILKGADGKLNPQGTATRAEVAAMVARYGDKVAI